MLVLVLDRRSWVLERSYKNSEEDEEWRMRTEKDCTLVGRLSDDPDIRSVNVRVSGVWRTNIMGIKDLMS